MEIRVETAADDTTIVLEMIELFKMLKMAEEDFIKIVKSRKHSPEQIAQALNHIKAGTSPTPNKETDNQRVTRKIHKTLRGTREELAKVSPGKTPESNGRKYPTVDDISSALIKNGTALSPARILANQCIEDINACRTSRIDWKSTIIRRLARIMPDQGLPTYLYTPKNLEAIKADIEEGINARTPDPSPTPLTPAAAARPTPASVEA